MSAPSDAIRALRESLGLPSELLDVDPDGSLVIEASAGTGKTYLLEHLVLLLLAEDRARLEDIVVMTFTERATAELVRRIRERIDRALARDDLPDELVKTRLQNARRSFDRATITTIHGFCQGVLTEHPLETGRLPGQVRADAKAVFGDAYRRALRTRLSVDPTLRRYLDTFLRTSYFEVLESTLFKAAAVDAPWATPYSEERLRAATRNLRALAPSELKRQKALAAALTPKARNLPEQIDAYATLAEAEAWLPFLIKLEANKDSYIGRIAQLPADTSFAEERRIATDLLAAAPTVREAIIQMLLPPVLEELRRRKLSDGVYDFDDMIRVVADAVEGPSGDTLVAKLRARFRFALVDEAQDTDPAQWRILRRVFLDSHRQGARNPVVLIGDPKQAIYGWRGADVHTYFVAAGEIAAASPAANPRLVLRHNRRSVAEVVEGYNLILDEEAPFFERKGPVHYDHPVASTRGSGGPEAGIALMRVEPTHGVPKLFDVRRALLRGISDEILRLRRQPVPARLAGIFVLTRSNAEANEVAEELREVGIPHVLFDQEGLFEGDEAAHVLSLLTAIEDPSDRVARFHAWLTPFFGARLVDLSACPEPPPEHPWVALLAGWKALADARDYARLWPSLLNDSGLARRLRVTPSGARSLANYRHLLELMALETADRPLSLGEVAARLAALAADRRQPENDSDAQRTESERDAVQILTIHKAKGLEADIVFVFGGLRDFTWPNATNRAYVDGLRTKCVGRPRLPSLNEARVRELRQEDQRLLYVALTRARQRLYLPYLPTVQNTDANDGPDSKPVVFEAFERVNGPYRAVNERLRALHQDAFRQPLPPPFPILRLPCPPPARGGQAEDENGAASPIVWQAPAALLADLPSPAAARADLARARGRGIEIVSYSRLKDRAGGYQAPSSSEDVPAVPGASAADPVQQLTLDDEIEATTLLSPLEQWDSPPPAVSAQAGDAVSERAPPERGTAARSLSLPGGVTTGLFLHAVLERAPLGPLPSLPEWRQRDDVRALIDAELFRWERDPRQGDEVARLVHAALTVALPLPDAATLQGVARAARVRREVPFLYPIAGATARTFVRGVIDVLFEHQGRVYFADWKSDALDDYEGRALGAHVQANYELQIGLYTLALVRMLGIDNAADYERRFGGFAYVFLRGLTAPGEGAPSLASVPAGIHVGRPSFEDVRAWEAQLPTLAATEVSPAHPAGGDA